ncbi:MAG: hypothetical protein V7724_17655 [Sediminicola sp.]|tara:strand:+ start:124805 stop:125485 length:681 start_codon:yes stop_codon:yes gene_type:complete
MRRIAVIIAWVLVAGCGSKDGPKPPGSVQLDFPLKDSECTTGVDLTETTSEVEFRWQPSENTDSYVIRVTDLLDNNSQSTTTAANSIKFTLDKGTPYSWSVTSQNTEVTETATSEIWRFYNAGSESSYAPFPARINTPASGASVLKDLNNDVELFWSGADVDGDITGYEIYFGAADPPGELLSTVLGDDTTTKVNVVSNTVYYWRVVTFDGEGNSSDSGVFQFKVL